MSRLSKTDAEEQLTKALEAYIIAVVTERLKREMQVGADTIKGTMKASIAKLRAIGIKARTRRVCDCQIKMSLTANMIRLTIPEGNIKVTLQLNDVVKGVEAAINQYNTRKQQDNFRQVTGMDEHRRAESE